jgi:hypothetical protein
LANSLIAARAISSRVFCFLRSRKPVATAKVYRD